LNIYILIHLFHVTPVFSVETTLSSHMSKYVDIKTFDAHSEKAETF